MYRDIAYLFINSEGPTSNVFEVIVGHMLDREYLAIFFGTRVVWPK